MMISPTCEQQDLPNGINTLLPVELLDLLLLSSILGGIKRMSHIVMLIICYSKISCFNIGIILKDTSLFFVLKDNAILQQHIVSPMYASSQTTIYGRILFPVLQRIYAYHSKTYHECMLYLKRSLIFQGIDLHMKESSTR